MSGQPLPGQKLLPRTSVKSGGHCPPAPLKCDVSSHAGSQGWSLLAPTIRAVCCGRVGSFLTRIVISEVGTIIILTTSDGWRIKPDPICMVPIFFPSSGEDSGNGLSSHVACSLELSVRGALTPAQPAACQECWRKPLLTLWRDMTVTTTIRSPVGDLPSLLCETPQKIRRVPRAHCGSVPFSGPTVSWPSLVLCLACLISVVWRLLFSRPLLISLGLRGALGTNPASLTSLHAAVFPGRPVPQHMLIIPVVF